MMLRKLSVYEKKPEKFDHESLLADMERDAEVMKRNLNLMGDALSRTIPFHSDVTCTEKEPEVRTV